MGEEQLPVLPDAMDSEEIANACQALREARTRGELAILLVREVSRFTMFDLQVLGGTLREEIRKLPSPYREAVEPYFVDQIFGMHHQLLIRFHNREFEYLHAPIHDMHLFEDFCDMIPRGCFHRVGGSETHISLNRPRYRFFYYLIACYTMFVQEYPGHPIGMPFPGPFRVERKNGIFLCPVRDKEKDVFYSICNFCPAQQKELF
jgi:uncharacterized protein (UPF0305 family)